jgi:hypothetical protein
MFSPETRLERNRDKARIAQLTKSINETWAGELGTAKSQSEKEQAWQVAASSTQYDQNELDWLRQKRIMKAAFNAGITIPKEHYAEDEWPYRGTLTDSGEMWLKKAISKQRKDTAKDWVAILSPIASFAIAILGLLVALRKR